MLNFAFLQPNDVPLAGNVNLTKWSGICVFDFEIYFLSNHDSKFTSTATHCSAALI